MRCEQALRTSGAAPAAAAAALDEIPPCPRHATREEWEAWYAGLTLEQQLNRDCGMADEEEERKRVERAERRRDRWSRDPFCYAQARRRGRFPRVDQIAPQVLSNTYRGDAVAGYCPHGFHRRTVRVSHRALVEEQMPRKVGEDARSRLAWIQERIAQDEADVREALRHVLHERHRVRFGRRRDHYPVAWNALWCLRSRLMALREMQREAVRETRAPRRGQLCLF